LGLGHHMGPDLLNTGYPAHGVVGIRSGVKRALEGDAVNALARPPTGFARQSISKIESATHQPRWWAREEVWAYPDVRKGECIMSKADEYRRYADEALRWATKVATQKKKTSSLILLAYGRKLQLRLKARHFRTIR
jgi:hypothetical protein